MLTLHYCRTQYMVGHDRVLLASRLNLTEAQVSWCTEKTYLSDVQCAVLFVHCAVMCNVFCHNVLNLKAVVVSNLS